MIRFTMPSSSLPREERIRLLDAQFEDFMTSDALKEYLEILDIHSTKPGDICEDMNTYNTRKRADGSIIESQEAPLNAFLNENKVKLFPLYDEMGLVSINKPVQKDFDKIIVLGGSANANYDRTAGAARFADDNVKEIIGLSCFRPIPPGERRNCKHPGPYETEFGSLMFAFNSLFPITEDTDKEVKDFPRNLNKAMNIRSYYDESGRIYRLFASPSLEETARPGTYDTIVHYLDNIGDDDPHRILVITNNQYCNYQFITFAKALLESGHDNIDFEIIGCSDDDHLTDAEGYVTGQFNIDIRSACEWIDKFRGSIH